MPPPARPGGQRRAGWWRPQTVGAGSRRPPAAVNVVGGERAWWTHRRQPQRRAAGSTFLAVLAALAADRPVFYSEKDFQLHLAWELKERGCDVRLECDPECFDANAAIDVLVVAPERVALELKYKTRRLACECGGQAYRLKDHAAEDHARYDAWKDVARLEAVVAAGRAGRGYAVFLTNNAGYWKAGRPGTADADFRMQEGRVASGRLVWAGHASAGTMKNRELPVHLAGRYEARWADYPDLQRPWGRFRYMLVEVSPRAPAT